MRLGTVTLSAAALGLAVAFVSLPAAADEAGTLSDCTKLAGEVNQALASNTQSASYEAAVKEKNNALGFCANGLYGYGVVHYEQALKLLGQEKS
jgi:hypothetical protein